MKDMEDDVIMTLCRNRFIDDNQLSYCRVEVNNENIDNINKVSIFFSRRRVETNLSLIGIGSEIYLILGGGVRVIRDRKDINTNLIKKDWDSLLHAIDKLSY